VKRLVAITLLLLSVRAGAQTYTLTTCTVAITNTSGTTNGQTITCNSDVRTWTNDVIVAASQVLTNNTQTGAAQNLLVALAANPFTGVAAYQTGTTNVVLRGAQNGVLTVTVSSGWATLTFVTNTYGLDIPVIIPHSVYTLQQQTNIISDLVNWLDQEQSTNLLNVRSTNVLLAPVSPLSATSNQTNYTVDLYPGVGGNLVQIYTANTNVFITLTGTNKSDWSRTVLLRGWTNTINIKVGFISRVRTNLNWIPWVTNGWSKVLHLYNADTTGTNVIVTDEGPFQ
jgi:hypothetical protein